MTAIGNLFGGKPKPPVPEAPTPMPDPEVSGAEARAKAQRDVLARAGRQSTILTAPKAKQPAAAGAGVNFDSYSSQKLSA